jgi:hypothetical protein
MQAKLDALKKIEPPNGTPLEAVHDERYAVVDELKKEYLALVDSIFTDNNTYSKKCQKIDKVKEVVDTLSYDNLLCGRLSELVADFEEHEQMDELKTRMSDQLAKFHSLRTVLNLNGPDHGEKYLCFTCLERPVDTFLDPCGHMACEQCQYRFKTTCPFCRTMITPKRMFGG